MKLICERTTFIPGFCVFSLHHNGVGVSRPRRTGDYLPSSHRYAEWLTVSNGQPGWLLGRVVSVVRLLEGGGRDVAAVIVQASVIEPFNPFRGGVLNLAIPALARACPSSDKYCDPRSSSGE